MKKLLLLLFVGITFPAGVSAQAKFFDNAFQRAADGWAVTAKVTMNAPGKEYISARGKVTLQSDGSLTGDLPMSLDNKAIANNTLRISIRKSDPAVVTITRMIAGKPFLGRSAAIVSLPVDPNFNYLSGTIQWGGSREIRVELEAEETPEQQMDKKQGVFKQNTSFEKDKRYLSEDKRYALVFQSDGNLVVYKIAGMKAIWNTHTNGRAVKSCVFQGDGNLVMYDYANKAVWDSNTDASRRDEAKKSWLERTFPNPDKFEPTDPGKWMTMQSDGNLVIYNGIYPNPYSVKWASNSFEKNN